jgi:putative membrane protein
MPLFPLSDMAHLPGLLWGTLTLRPYVFAFLAVFLAAGARDLGWPRTAGFLLWGWGVAFAAEYASTRLGIPFGLYHYTGETRGTELYLADVPFFDSLSFPFLAYAAFCLARVALRRSEGGGVVALAGVLMMLLDVVIDPLAVRGERWFLGRIFYYPDGGVYFGVPVSNFLGWAVVGWIIVGGYAWAARGRGPAPRAPWPGVGLYYGVLVFNLALTAWIGEPWLLGAGILVHVSAFLVLYVVSMWAAAPGCAGGHTVRSASGAAGPVRSTEPRNDRV